CPFMPIRWTGCGLRLRPLPSAFWQRCILRSPRRNSIPSRSCDMNDPMTQTASSSLLRADGLTKSFRSGSEEVVVLDDLSMGVRAGEFVALVGASGSGKTTLLHLLAALDTPTKGEVYFEGRRLSEYREDDRALYRNEKIGFVWQMHYLLPEFSALENVVIPQLIRGSGMSGARARAR